MQVTSRNRILKGIETFRELFDVSEVKYKLVMNFDLRDTIPYPLLGPRFIGTLLKEHLEPTRLQLEHCSILVSDVASHRI